ncbi:MAG: alanine racemase [Betaproteobacteria bacterium]|nr:alanine racemase [Betaproteobacteria bacterium]
MPRPLQASIELSALSHNLSVAQRAAPAARTFAVIKANAYGHGLMRCASALAAADGFALLEIDAAVRLREAGYRQPILLLEGVFDADELAVAAHNGFACALHDPDQVAMLRDLPSNARLDVFVKLNTGMNRLGLRPDSLGEVLERLAANARVRSVTLMTHFACADDDRGIAEQLQRFLDAARDRALPHSIANSATILRFPEAHGDWIRPGIMLYGASPFADRPATALGLRPVMTLTSRIIGVQELAAGDAVGYGATFVAKERMRIGVVACGYADGYPRHAPSGTPALVEGVRTGTVGRVSMDMLCVDITRIPGAGVGSPVTLWGEGLSADEVAAVAGTVSYELFCALAPRVRVVER